MGKLENEKIIPRIIGGGMAIAAIVLLGTEIMKQRILRTEYGTSGSLDVVAEGEHWLLEDGQDLLLNRGVLHTPHGDVYVEWIDFGQNNCWSFVLGRAGLPFKDTDWIEPTEGLKILAQNYDLVNTVTEDFANVDLSQYPAGTLIVFNRYEPLNPEEVLRGAHVAVLIDPAVGGTANDNGRLGVYYATYETVIIGGMAVYYPSLFPGDIADELINRLHIKDLNPLTRLSSVELWVPKGASAEF